MNLMTGLLGRFYFKQTSNGHLIGEFSNDQSNAVMTESADLVERKEGKFNGVYRSTWQENGVVCSATLTISQPTNRSVFRLAWVGATNFKGGGMLCDDTLIGDYQVA